MEDKLIVWYSRKGEVLAVFPDLETAVRETGINKNIIFRNLKGWMNDCPNGTRFRYEIKAGDLRRKKIKERNLKEQAKADKLWKELGDGEDDRH